MLIANFNQRTAFLQPWSYAYNVAKELAVLGYNVTIITNQQSNAFSISDYPREIPIQMLPTNDLRFLDRKSLEIIKQKKPEVMYWFGNSLSGIYLKRLRSLQVPFVLHVSAVHYSLADLRYLSFREKLLNLLHILTAIPPASFFVRLLNDAMITIITVPSKASKDGLCDFGVSENKIMIAPLVFHAKAFPYDKKRTMISVRNDLGLNAESFIATYLGSPDTIRGTDTFINCTKVLKSRLKKPFNFLILSRRDLQKESKDEKLLHKLVEKNGLASYVSIIPGILPREEVINYLLASNVIVLPFKFTLSEPSIALLEAMTLGKPVVTTETCGLPEIVTPDRGVLIKPGNSRELASALHFLALNPELAARLGRQGKNFVTNLPGWDELGKWVKDVLFKAVQ